MTTTSTGRGMAGGMGSGMGNMGSVMSGMMPMMASMMQPMMSGMNSMMNSMMPAMSGAMTGGMMMAPRCTMTMEKTQNGMACNCTCEDETSAMMLQNLVRMTQGGMCSMALIMNGMMCCACNMGMMGMCKMEMTDTGCRMTCTSGDPNCMKMIQACCDCMTACMSSGCMCCMMMNGMPICCSMNA